MPLAGASLSTGVFIVHGMALDTVFIWWHYLDTWSHCPVDWGCAVNVQSDGCIWKRGRGSALSVFLGHSLGVYRHRTVALTRYAVLAIWNLQSTYSTMALSWGVGVVYWDYVSAQWHFLDARALSTGTVSCPNNGTIIMHGRLLMLWCVSLYLSSVF